MESAKAAKEADEKTSTEKTKRYRSTIRSAIAVAGGVLILLLVTFFPGFFGGWRSSKPMLVAPPTSTVIATASSPIPLTSLPKSEWKKLPLQAGIGEKSELVAVPPHMRPVVEGDDFLLYNVYLDGRECAFGDVCGDAPLRGFYVSNRRSGPNIVMYAFE